MTLFIAEDSIADLVLLRLAVAEAGANWTIQSTTNADEAISAMRRPGFCPDLILLDLHIPGAPISELLHVIRTEESLGGIPVAVWSGLIFEEERKTVRRFGPCPIFEKPVDLDSWVDLARALDQIGSSRSQASNQPANSPKRLAAKPCAA
jgi:CheY-like chemotaxis protein